MPSIFANLLIWDKIEETSAKCAFLLLNKVRIHWIEQKIHHNVNKNYCYNTVISVFALMRSCYVTTRMYKFYRLTGVWQWGRMWWKAFAAVSCLIAVTKRDSNVNFAEMRRLHKSSIHCTEKLQKIWAVLHQGTSAVSCCIIMIMLHYHSRAAAWYVCVVDIEEQILVCNIVWSQVNFFLRCYSLLRCQMGARKLRWLAASANAGLSQCIFVINAIYGDTGTL